MAEEVHLPKVPLDHVHCRVVQPRVLQDQHVDCIHTPLLQNAKHVYMAVVLPNKIRISLSERNQRRMNLSFETYRGA
jgi:hypothetical protein